MFTTVKSGAATEGQEIIGPYHLGRKLGQGHFAKVRMGEDKYKNKVAIKIFHKEAMKSQRTSVHQYSLTHMERELNALRICSPHPHIASMYEVLETDSHLYCVMEYVAGGELYNYIVSEGYIQEPEACRLFYQMVHAVQYCHKHGISHRDLKPENILLDRKLNIKLVDFGLASWAGEGNMVEANQLLLQTQCGSPEYAAPEVLRAKTRKGYMGATADVWSLGVVLYAMLCGTLPFTAPSVRLVIGNILRGAFTMPSHLSPHAQLLLKHILTVDPTHRATLDQVMQHPWIRFRAKNFPTISVNKPLNVPDSFGEGKFLTSDHSASFSSKNMRTPEDDSALPFDGDGGFKREGMSNSASSNKAAHEELEEDKGEELRKTICKELFLCAEHGDVKKLEQLLEKHREAIDFRAKGIDNFTALHFAARKGHSDIMKAILRSLKPVNIDAKTKSEWTPLMMAADRGYTNVVELLLEYGADIHAKNNAGKSAIFLARESGQLPIATMLTSASSKRTKRSSTYCPSMQFQFMRAAEEGDLNQMRHLERVSRKLLAAHARSEARAQANPPDASGRAKAKVSQPKMNRFKIDIAGQGIDNWTALHFAARKGHLAVCQSLVAALRLENINAFTKTGWTPLMMAAEKGHLDVVKLLVRRGAEVELVNKANKTAADLAGAVGMKQTVDYLRGRLNVADGIVPADANISAP
jgi:serine/threonine protein kinase